ncbi:uncharacterized protein N7482_010389 [Penicillium canariense]|uniref:Uncharacterized protein n=1 Tax=Penicillium canariense TaxID=189055 RepID=A0A9W9HMV2_9EURO|nr:uncharacterized protein N7482_010389 [Penicillium canariense]KAJ5151137.1 hypothetical protein N7482_010389 [Penicillium canariense]
MAATSRIDICIGTLGRSGGHRPTKGDPGRLSSRKGTRNLASSAGIPTYIALIILLTVVDPHQTQVGQGLRALCVRRNMGKCFWPQVLPQADLRNRIYDAEPELAHLPNPSSATGHFTIYDRVTQSDQLAGEQILLQHLHHGHEHGEDRDHEGRDRGSGG